ncbi:hypothetical protein [Catenulispora rubra]|uniref:hypothetical protein n=1 Tax=Catenulispora rubra TaxID=280293 RepID=UPI0018927594|nr:hypothetical protein [Catenulispora rubra]
MHEDFEAELRENVARFTERTVPPSAASVRTRGERFHRRRVAGTVGVAMALVAGVGITSVAATNGGSQRVTAPIPSPNISTGLTTGSATVSPDQQAPAVAPVPTNAGTTTQSGAGPVDLALHPPVQYAAGVLNPVTFTVDDHGPAVSGVTVTLTLTRPKSEVANTTGPWPLDLILRHDPVTGIWTNVAVTFLNNGVDPHGEDVRVAHYTLDLPSGTSTEQLLIDPEGSFFTLGVKLTAGSLTLAQAQTDKIAVKFLPMTVSGPKTLTPGTTGEFDVTLTNDTPIKYPPIAFWTTDVVTSSPISRAVQVQVYDGTGWSTVSFDQDGSVFLNIQPLAPGATTTVRLRITLASNTPTGATGDLGIAAHVVGGFNAADTSAGLPPGGETRTDTFFAVK